ncbi:hypothetical protein TsFJ059_007369 [Trichoderma semiorbis]|uniref:SHSP domain-containing protein n=1 Tax=Trichoderma semiorbis TaxID=1491008 RepID=A0A9P8KSI6_9HYPO|nr:hypothetical protein TsFJ059_007369 [Trichoderma semiorbis]
MPPQQHPFWDFMQSLNNPNPNNRRDPGHGVDHNTSPPGPFPGFPGLPFGAPPPPHGGHPPHQPHQPHPPPPPPPGAGPGPWWDQAPPAWAYWFNNNFNGPPRYDEHPFSHDAAGVNLPHRDAPREGEAPREKNNEASSSPETMQDGEPFPDPAEVTPSESDDEEDNNRREGVPPPPSYPAEGGRRGRGRGGHAHAHGRGGRCGGRRGWRRGGPFEGPGAGGPPFDFPGMMRGFMGHPFFRNIRDQAAQYAQPSTTRNANTEDENTFSPPIDIFNTPDAFILHTALPGAKKDDVGVTWNPQTRSLRIAGVVHRPGDEAFLQTLTGVRERRVGVFEREVKLPPESETEKKADGEEADLDVDVDGFGITAKMEEGILIVTVPKVEKEWMEVREVDIA